MRLRLTVVFLFPGVLGCSAAEPPGATVRASSGLGERLRTLAPALTHPDRIHRRATVLALGAVGSDAVATLAEGLAQERDPAVRQAYARALGAAGGEPAMGLLARLAGRTSESLGTRLAAVQGLVAAGPPAGPRLLQLAGGSDPVARSARLGLVMTGGAEARRFFLRALAAAPAAGVARSDALAGFARLAGRDDLPRLRLLAADPDPETRRLAWSAIGRISASPGDRRLAARLAATDDDARVRRAAAVAAYRIGGRESP